jgi:tricorn protease
MLRSRLPLLLLLLVTLIPAARGQGLPAPFMRRPDIHGDQVVFTCEGDLWLGSVKDGEARRVTTHEGLEQAAHFSPDGKSLAFTAQYDGGMDVYVMPVEGGAPRRLTYDPSGALVLGWMPDGKNILYRSRRGSAESGNRLWSVPAEGGMPKLLPVPKGEFAAINADGHRMTYVPVSGEWQHWKRYRGGEADDVWLADLESHAFRRLTDFEGVDTSPAWVGSAIYFVSERDGLANLYRMDASGGKATAATHYDDYDVRYPASDGKRLVFQHGNGLALYDPGSGKTRELAFALHSDRIHSRARRVPAQPWVYGASIGPTGKRMLAEARGQLFSVPVENGDARSVVAMPGARAQFASWSPDGKLIGYVSDKSGEEQVWVIPAAGGEPRQVTRDHQGPLGELVWSPDSKKIAVSDREMRIFMVDVASGSLTQVDQSERGSSYDATNYSYRFSPDSKWLAYSSTETNQNDVIYLYNVESGKKTPVTRREMNSASPAFDPTGKYLVFLADRAFNPRGSGPNRFYGYDKTTKVSLVTLAADTPSPFLTTNDEEGEPDKPAEKPADKPAGTPPVPPATKVDLDGLDQRIVEVPVPADRYNHVEALDGRLLMQVDVTGDGPAQGGANQLRAFDLKKKEASVVVNRLDGFEVSANQKKILVLRPGREYQVADATAASITPGTGRVDLSGLMLSLDPPAEWGQIFNEGWRIARDFFYDPGLHGVDWNAVRTKYARQLPSVGDRSDLNEILGEMIAELNVGHAYVGGGDMPPGASRIPMGYLGADFEPAADGDAFKVVKVYPGDEFDLDARSPLLAPGVNVRSGDYILAVAGQPVHTDQDLQALLIGTAGKVVTLTVNSKPVREGSREVRIKPMASESSARYYDWVAGRREYVRTHGGENLGYLHIPDMGDGGLREFAKHYYPNVEKDGMVYDVRNNGGGYISAMLLLQMSAPPYTYFKPRHGTSWTRQDWGFSGYSAALCNQNSGSNAEEFCDGFQRLKLGPVIGTRTWGGEVGSGGGYRLVDGGALYIPNYAAWAPDGKWIIEGTGVTPDVEVENDPAAVLAGRDPQLDRAIAYLKEQIRKCPVVHPLPPPFPNKAYRPAEKR